MGFFDRQEKPRTTAEQAAVARLDARFAKWSEPQKEALAEILIRLLPSLFAQESAVSALPMADLGEALKEFGFTLLPRLLSPEKCLEAVGAAFLTHAEVIRGFCIKIVERYKSRAAATEVAATILEGALPEPLTGILHETKLLSSDSPPPEGAANVLRLVP